MIIDIHTHLANHKIFSDGFLQGVAETFFPANSTNPAMVKKIVLSSLKDETCTKFIKQMDDANIDKSVLLIADYGYSMGEAEYSIEEIHDLHHNLIREYPKLFEVFGGVDPRRGQVGYDLFEKSIKEYGFKGLKLYPPCGFELSDKEVYPLYEMCNELSLPVLTHTGPALNTMRTEQKYPGSVQKVAKEFPNIKFILGHGGARDYETSVRLAQECENIWFDISAFQNYIEDLDDTKKRFRMFFDKVPDKVLFGSDWPMFSIRGPQNKWVNFMYDLNVLTEDELDKLFYRNAHTVLYE
mgnify:CR=1 FL=1